MIDVAGNRVFYGVTRNKSKKGALRPWWKFWAQA
jgi:hypothetical protein